MRKFSIHVNKSSKIASLSLDVINDFDRENQVNALNRIAELFISRKIYVVYLKSNNSETNFDFKNFDFVTIKSQKWYDLIAAKIDNEHLNDIIKASTQNDERTEIYYIDEYDWNKFLEHECKMQHNEYNACLVVNDNGQTFIDFSLEKFNLDEITRQINAIFKNFLGL